MANNESSDLIEEAVNQAMTNSEDYEEGDVLVDWVLVAFTANPNKEKGYLYPMFVSNGHMPSYRVMGLLDMARHAYEDD